MIRQNQMRVRKPYNYIIDDMIRDGYGSIDLRENNTRPNGFAKWMYLLRLQRDSKAFNIKCVKSNKFMVLPRISMSKDVKRSMGGKYAIYNLQ